MRRTEASSSCVHGNWQVQTSAHDCPRMQRATGGSQARWGAVAVWPLDGLGWAEVRFDGSG